MSLFQKADSKLFDADFIPKNTLEGKAMLKSPLGEMLNVLKTGDTSYGRIESFSKLAKAGDAKGLSAATKEGKRLIYGSLEGAEHAVYTRGKLSGDDTIELPEYWTGLVDENTITVQLTAMGGHQDLWVEEIMDNKIKIGASRIPVSCFYLVHAERKDVDKLEIEVDA